MAQPAATGAPTAARMSAVVDMRRRGPEPPWAGPEIEFKPGMAREMLRELAPLLAEEGIHLDERGEFSDVDVSSTGFSGDWVVMRRAVAGR
jgi:hypothetical protein